MSEDHEIHQRLKILAPVFEDTLTWYTRVLTQGFCDEETAPKKLQSFLYWLQDAEHDDFFLPSELEKLQNQYELMMDGAVGFLSAEKNDKNTTFQSFTKDYLQFISLLRTIEMSCIISDSGLDSLTGLRSKEAIEKDYEMEMNRVVRDGREFVIAFVAIDHFEQIQAENDPETCKAYIVTMAENIKKIVRGFDDACFLGGGEFVILLKQTDILGSLSASDRLRKLIEENRMMVQRGGKMQALTFSSTTSAPLPGDILQDLLSRMRVYLADYKDEENITLEYRESSPIERFIATSD